MAANTLFSDAYLYLCDDDGKPLVGAQLFVYIAGSTTAQPVYHDSDLGSAWTQPIVTNAAGKSTGPIYVSPTPALKLVALDADDVPISGYPLDNWSPSQVAT